MTWIILAILAHISNAVVFVIDTSLLQKPTRISSPLRYTLYSSLLAGASIIVLPFGYAPIPWNITPWFLVAGLFHIAALWFFFTALQRGEASRVVPIVGALVPLITLILASLFLQESLEQTTLMAIILLMIGSIFLSVHRKANRYLSPLHVLNMVLSGACFAAYFSLMKYIYSQEVPFLASFVYSRMTEAMLVVVLLGPIVFLRKKTRTTTISSPASKTGIVAGLFVGNKVLAAVAFLLQHYAISLGSVSVVNALQGTQYVFLLLLTTTLSFLAPNIMHEEKDRLTLAQKVIGITCIGIALALLV